MTANTVSAASSSQNRFIKFCDNTQKNIYNTYAGSSETDLISGDFFNNHLNHLTPLGSHIDGFSGLGNALFFMFLTYWLGEKRAEYARYFEKGFRDVNRVKNGILGSLRACCGPHLNTFVAIGLGLSIGAIYSGLLMFLHYENRTIKETTQQHWELYHKLKQLNQTSSLLAPKVANDQLSQLQQQITPDTYHAQNRHQFNACLVGSISGPYLAFSLYQIITFATTLAHATLNPLPFLVAGLFLGILFAWKQMHDQRQLHRHKTLSVLACQIEQQKIIARLENDETDSLKKITHKNELSMKEEKYQKIKQEFEKHEKNKTSATGTITESTVSGLKNNTIGLLGAVSVVSFLSEKTSMVTMAMGSLLFFCKLLAGSTFVAALGGPAGISILITVVVAMTAYTLWRNYKKKRESTPPIQTIKRLKSKKNSMDIPLPQPSSTRLNTSSSLDFVPKI